MKKSIILLLLLPLLLLGGDYGKSRYAIGKGKLQIGTNLTFNYAKHTDADDPVMAFGFGNRSHFNTFHPSGTGFTVGYGITDERSVGINFQLARMIKVGSENGSQFLGSPAIYYSSAVKKREVSIVFSPYINLPFFQINDNNPAGDTAHFEQPFAAGINMVLGSEGNIPEVGEILMSGHYQAAENSGADAVFEFGIGVLGGWRYNDTDSIKAGLIYQTPNLNASGQDDKSGFFEGTYLIDFLLDLYISKVGQLTMDIYYVLPIQSVEDTVSFGLNIGFKATF